MYLSTTFPTQMYFTIYFTIYFTMYCTVVLFLLTVSAVDVGFTGQTVEACVGDEVTVTWNGHHNIQETESASCDSADLEEVEGYNDAGHVATYNIFAQPGETRYFKCGTHCASGSKFSVTCPKCVGVVDVSCGVFACGAVMTDGTARVWGTATRGARTDTLSGVTHVSCGHSTCVALMTDDTIQKWGFKYDDEPTNWEDLEDVVDAFCIENICAVRTKNGTVYVWGPSYYNIVKTLTNVVDISCNGYACVALKTDSSVYAWGHGSYGGSTSGVDLSKNVINITCGLGACVAIMNDTSIRAWGQNDRGGIEPTLSDVVRVSCPGFACFAIMDNGTATVWGGNDYGGDIT